MPTAPRVSLHRTKVLVTGAATGSIGGETARLLREWGADVVTTTRSSTPPLDLGDPRSVRAFATWYAQEHGTLDVLINNAGVHLDLMSSWQQPHLLPDGLEVHWRVNYLGTMHLTSLLVPLMGSGSRIVNVVSKLHHRGRNAALFGPAEKYSSWDAYGTSKLALVHTTQEQQDRYDGIDAFCLHPGEVLTDIATKGLAEHRVISAVRTALRPLEALVLATPTEGAQTSVFVATQSGLPGGEYFARCAVAPKNPEAADRTVSARLWDQTQEWLSQLSR
jgi:NAD(P)-dependent dehydrogenase (short-subunit alcohol dehydrogenase family)